MTSTSINDLIPSELLFRTFRFFDEYEFVKLREVCKSWLEIIDENRLLWQVANLAREEVSNWDEESGKEIVTGEGKDPEWNEKVLKLFDEKSRSTLKEASLKFKMFGLNAKGGYKNRAEDWCFREFVQVISKSRSTLRVLSLEMSTIPDGLLQALFLALDYRTMPLVDFRLWQGEYSGSPHNVKILRQSPSEVGKQVSKEGVVLQVLWTQSLPELLLETEPYLHSLVSLRIDQSCVAATLHSLLKPLSPKLKHLTLFIVNDYWDLELLCFPKLEVLALCSNLDHPEFPHWISGPSSLKLSTFDVYHGLPSIAELLIQTLEDCTPLSGRCPLLHTFRFELYDSSTESLNLSNLVKLLKERRAQVEAGMEIDGIKMQNIKTVILPFCWFWGDDKSCGALVLEQVKSLVETVIDSGENGENREKWEIII